MSNWDLKPGDKVVCVSNSFDCYVGEGAPVKGNVYTIRSLFAWQDYVGLCFEEILNPTIRTTIGPIERGYYAEAFRPVRNTSIDCFKVHLLQTPSPIKQKENQNA